jgi:hypothetical protein
LILSFIFAFSLLLIVRFRNTDVAHRYLSYSSFKSSLLCQRVIIWSRALTVCVYFFTNWNITGIFDVLWKVERITRFLSRNSAYSVLPHFFIVNLVVSLIATFEKLNLGSYGFKFLDDDIFENLVVVIIFFNCLILLARSFSNGLYGFCRDT